MSVPARRLAHAVPALCCSLVAACGGGAGDTTTDPPSDPPVVVTPLVAGRVTVLEGDGQTGVAGTALPVPLAIEVRDTRGQVMPGFRLEIAELSPVDGHVGDPANLDPTDASGVVHYDWIPGVSAGVHRLRVVAYGPNNGPVVAADTLSATVIPGPAYRLVYPDSYSTPEAFLGESIDLAALPAVAQDLWGNAVTVTSRTVTAPAPLQVNGTVVTATAEADVVVQLVINGVPFGVGVRFYRDLRDLAGAHGGWVCQSDPGAGGMTPGLTIHRRDATVVLDSVLRSPPSGGLYSFYFDLSWVDHWSDGTTTSGHQVDIRKVVSQGVGGWMWENGPDMQLTAPSPLTYTQARADECVSWESGATNLVEQPLWISK
jgi:hypothetical protein